MAAEGQAQHMEAGAERRLMQIKYHGIERVIEPYSLSHKKAEDKPAREYFYAHDTTRGDHIKMFVNTDVESLAILDERFEPRHEIELSKAGEEGRKAYFGKPFSETRHARVGRSKSTRIASPRKVRGFGGFEQTYKVQCPYCQKVFTRKTQSLDLSLHKSPDGYRCSARRRFRIF